MWFDSDAAFGLLALASIYRNELTGARTHLEQSARYRSMYAHNPVQWLTLADALVADAVGDAERRNEMVAAMVDRDEARVQSLAIEPPQGPLLVRLALRADDRSRAEL